MSTAGIWIALAALAGSPAVNVQRTPALDLGPPPFVMWAMPALTHVRHGAEPHAELAGALRHGDAVRVVELVAADGAPTWALLEGAGAVLLSSLRPVADRPLAAKVVAAEAQFVYGRVRTADAQEFALPDGTSRQQRRQPAARLLAFVPDKTLLAKGWLWHAGGGYMRLADLEMLTLSAFAGEREPKLPLAFVRRRTRLRTTAPAGPQQFVQRYQRMTVLHEHDGFVDVLGGSLPRSRVRVAYATPRPAEIPVEAKWLHVDLVEQTVVAYVGERPVLATMMSSGRSPHLTTQGVFRFYAKTSHSTMRGAGAHGYVAEEVPWVMHFFEGQAMHGAYWHDQFGIVKSHGCLNLSPTDAKWLFDWTPPALPSGWHTRLLGKGETGVYLEIDSTSTHP